MDHLGAVLKKQRNFNLFLVRLPGRLDYLSLHQQTKTDAAIHGQVSSAYHCSRGRVKGSQIASFISCPKRSEKTMAKALSAISAVCNYACIHLWRRVHVFLGLDMMIMDISTYCSETREGP